jgi:hypothetical protein
VEGNDELDLEEETLRHWLAAAAILTTLAIAGVACGGGDEKTIDLGDGDEITIGGDLPDDFPDDFPIYDDADLQGAVQGEEEGIEGIVATWTTGDDLDDVTAFYEDAFDDGPWKTTAEGTASGTSYWAVENSETGKVGYVSVSGGGDEVAIIATVGDNPDAASSGGDDSDDSASDDDGSDDEASSDGSDGGGGGDTSLPEEIDLPSDFPSDDVPLPDDAHVNTANTVTSNGITIFTVGFYSKESVDDLASFYKNELEGQGFTQSIQTSDQNGIYAAYAENSDGSGRTVIVTAYDGDVDGYRQVVLQVSG